MSLPKDFLWGFATASYQIEGSTTADGRGPSIWDTFCAVPGKIADGSSGAVACDSYRRALTDDVPLLARLGARAYRFSISWSRVIPLGGRADPVNPAGVAYYVRLVDALLAAGIVPFVTLYHWDLPDALDRRYGGLLDREEFPRDFERFARVCFEALPKVRRWITFNEPWCSAVLGYGVGVFAPGRCSDRARAREGDSSTEPWVVGHNILLAHARAVRAYREEFQTPARERHAAGDGLGEGEIGITLNGDATYPWDPQDPADVAAAERKLEFSIGWFADPIFGRCSDGDGDGDGDDDGGSSSPSSCLYPPSMRAQLGDHLPRFTPEERAMVRGSSDFYGMNHYTANYIRNRAVPDADDVNGSVELLFENKAGDVIGPETQSAWLRPHPEGFRALLLWLTRRYGRPRIYVTENGTSDSKRPREEGGAATASAAAAADDDGVDDELRVRYFDGYVRAMARAVVEGADVRAYLAWSLLDNFEWAEGYATRFGVTRVEFGDGQRRVPKRSAWTLRPLVEGLMEDGGQGEGEEGEGDEGKGEDGKRRWMVEYMKRKSARRSKGDGPRL